MKKGQTVYIKSTIGLLPNCNGYEGKILRVNKKNGENYSLRIHVEKSFRFDKGARNYKYDTTIRLNIASYEIFTDKDLFMKSMADAIENFIIVAQKSVFEIIDIFS